MAGISRPWNHTFGLILSLAVGLQTACNEAGFQSDRNVLDDKSSNAQAGDASGLPSASGDAIVGTSGQTSAPVEITEISTNKKPDTIINSFQAALVKDASYRFTLEPKSVKTEFALEDELAPAKDTFTQISRDPLTDTFTQGNAGSSMTESFDQSARKGLVDILVVIDNSGSMKEEQVNLSSKLNELLASIKDANWQISIITTSPAVPAGVTLNSADAEGKELCNTTLIKSGEVDAVDKFATAINAGISGHGNEQGIRQSVVGLRCTEKPWVRPASSLAVLIVSDEDNCSLDGKDCGTLPWAKESYLINYVETTLQRTVGKNAGFYGIVAPSKALCSTAGNAATQYLRLFGYKANEALNYGNICDASYKTTLNRISDSIALLLDNQFELKASPDTNTLNLSLQLMDGSSKPLDAGSYTQIGKVITFLPGKEPPPGSKVLADYRAGAKPILTSFTLSKEPAAGTLIAKINGSVVAPSSYAVSGRVVTFAQAPADMAKLIIDYRDNKSLLDRFKTTAPALGDSVKVSVNGQATKNFTFDAAKSEVLLQSIPSDGQAVEISYEKIIGPRLSYTLPISKEGRNFKILDQGIPLAFTQNGGSFTISASAYKVGKILTLSYDVPDAATKVIEIGRMPNAGSGEISSLQGNCELGMGFDILEDKLISTCAVGAAMEFMLSYKYTETLKIFKVKGIENPELGHWAVYVDGEATKDYVRSGSTIALNQDPGADARIDIHYTLPE